MTFSENAISYRTSRDGPIARQVSRLLTGLVEWVDETYEAPEQIVYSRQRCRTRIVSTRYSDGGLAYRDVGIAVHGSYGSCDAPNYHTHGAGIAAFRVEDNAFWHTTAIQGSIMPISGDVLYATTQLERNLNTEDEIGLEVEGTLRWNRTFDAPEELGEHLETVRKLCVGAFTMREAAELLIGVPAGISESNVLDAYTS